MTALRASRWNRPEPRPDADPSTKRRQLKFAASLGLFASALLAVACLSGLELHRELLARGQLADAVVFEIRAATISDSPRSRIRFRTPDGAAIETNHPSSLSFDQPPVGTKLQIVYDPADPMRVGYAGWPDELKKDALLAGFAVFWGWIGVRSYRRMKAIPRPPPSDRKRRGRRGPADAPLTPSSTAAPPASPDR